MRHAKLLPLALGSVALACTAESAPEVQQDAVAADSAHYTSLFENDAVRLVRITYGPGETSVMHHHPASCAVALSDATWSMELPDGTVVADTGSVGDIDCFEAEDHLPTNTSSGRAELILIEFKEGATPRSDPMPQAPAADVADPAHYSVEFQNDVARVLDIHYRAGEASQMHHHPANCAIFIQFQPATFALPDGTVVDVPQYELGDVECFDAEAHLPTNNGEGEIHVVLLELKGRAAFE